MMGVLQIYVTSIALVLVVTESAPLRPRVGSKFHASLMQPLFLLHVGPLWSIVIFLGGGFQGRDQHPTPLREPYQQHECRAGDDHDTHVLNSYFRLIGRRCEEYAHG